MANAVIQDDIVSKNTKVRATARAPVIVTRRGSRPRRPATFVSADVGCWFYVTCHASMHGMIDVEALFINNEQPRHAQAYLSYQNNSTCASPSLALAWLGSPQLG